MDFLDPKKKRAHRTRLTIGYVLIGLIIICVTVIVVLMVKGYGYDRKTGKVIQNGLVFVDSKPVSAKLTVDGQDKGQTADRLLLPEGNHSFVLSRDGYRDWKTAIDVQGGTIERLIYALILPKQLVVDDVKIFSSTPVLASQSPDHKTLLVLKANASSNFETYDLSSKSLTNRQVNLPVSLVTSSTKNNWQVVDWATNSRNVLVKHSYGSSSEYLIIDVRNPARSINLSKLLSNEVINDVRLYNGKIDQIYYRTKNNQLKLVDPVNKRTTFSLNNIVAYQPAGPDLVAYVTTVNPKTHLAKFGIHAATSLTIRSLPSSKNYFVELGDFNGHWYAAAGGTADNKVYVYKDPSQVLKAQPNQTLVPATVLKSVNKPTALSFSPGKEFVALQSASSFTVYDFQTNRLYDYDTKLKLASGQKAEWLDGYHMYAVSKGKANIWDFNGDNQQATISAKSSLPLSVTPNYQSLFSFNLVKSSKTKVALQQTSLLLPNQ